ncbi:hypothetical protein ACFCVU_29115 [Peribacillus butanolivorans]
MLFHFKATGVQLLSMFYRRLPYRGFDTNPWGEADEMAATSFFP